MLNIVCDHLSFNIFSNSSAKPAVQVTLQVEELKDNDIMDKHRLSSL